MFLHCGRHIPRITKKICVMHKKCWEGQFICGLEQRRFQTADQSLIYTGQAGVAAIIHRFQFSSSRHESRLLYLHTFVNLFSPHWRTFAATEP